MIRVGSIALYLVACVCFALVAWKAEVRAARYLAAGASVAFGLGAVAFWAGL